MLCPLIKAALGDAARQVEVSSISRAVCPLIKAALGDAAFPRLVILEADYEVSTDQGRVG